MLQIMSSVLPLLFFFPPLRGGYFLSLPYLTYILNVSIFFQRGMYSIKSVRSVLGTRSRSPGQDGFDEYHTEFIRKSLLLQRRDGCFRLRSERQDSTRARDLHRILKVVPRARTQRFRRNHSPPDHKAFVLSNLP